MCSIDTMSLGYNVSDNSSVCEIRDNSLSPLLPVGYSIICCIGLLNNSISIFLLFLQRNANTSMAVYMRHLSLADMLLVLCLPLRVHYHNRQGPFIVCRVVGILFYINMYASISFLSLISLDRYLKITKPVWVFRVQKVCWSRRASYAIWSILFLVTCLFFMSSRWENPCNRICFHFHDQGQLTGGINLMVVALFGGLFLLFVIFYVKIALKLRTVQMGKGNSNNQDDRKMIILKTFLVPGIFTLCFLPYHLVRVPYVLAQMKSIARLESKQQLHTWNEITLLLSTLNSCLDPIIYYFLSSVYRKTLLCLKELTNHSKSTDDKNFMKREKPMNCDESILDDSCLMLNVQQGREYPYSAKQSLFSCV
uniref:G-protein coupled receptors family 1 profile domain-containing protein n=1 Tax=Electrophorus electricus TaxID=8005 RepID=A0A4W4H469_ELEEL